MLQYNALGRLKRLHITLRQGVQSSNFNKHTLVFKTFFLIFLKMHLVLIFFTVLRIQSIKLKIEFGIFVFDEFEFSRSFSKIAFEFSRSQKS